MTLKSFFLAFTLCFSLCSRAQQKKLGADDFKTMVVDQWWSFENKDTKGTCDMQIFIVKSLDFELNCINWTNGFSGNKCNYDLSLIDNFFELKPKKCQNKSVAEFIYGYLSESSLYLLISNKQLAMSPSLLSNKNWIPFEKIKK